MPVIGFDELRHILPDGIVNVYQVTVFQVFGLQGLGGGLEPAAVGRQAATVKGLRVVGYNAHRLRLRQAVVYVIAVLHGVLCRLHGGGTASHEFPLGFRRLDAYERPIVRPEGLLPAVHPLGLFDIQALPPGEVPRRHGQDGMDMRVIRPILRIPGNLDGPEPALDRRLDMTVIHQPGPCPGQLPQGTPQGIPWDVPDRQGQEQEHGPMLPLHQVQDLA